MSDLRRAGLSAQAVCEEHLAPRVPVVLTDTAVTALCEQRRWAPFSLGRTFSDRLVPIEPHGPGPLGPPESSPSTPPASSARFAAQERVTFGRYERKVRRQARLWRAGQAVVAVPYLRNQWVSQVFPELLPAVRRPDFLAGNLLARPELADLVPGLWQDWLEFFLSAPGVLYPEVHVDTHLTHAWLAQVWGSKRLYLWPPRHTGSGVDEVDGVEQRLADSDEQHDVFHRDELAALFAHAEPLIVDLHAGETAVIPAGWWHTTETLELSVTLSGNFVLADNTVEFCAAAKKVAQGHDEGSPLWRLGREISSRVRSLQG